MKNITGEKAEEKIKEFFENIQAKKPEEIKKIKKLAMHHNIKLKDKRKLFCKKCFSTKLKVKSIKNGKKTIECRNCGYVGRWKLK